jgi:AraC-like DNA-binding protein
MKAKLYSTTLTTDTSFSCERIEAHFFERPLHFHHEIELVLIEKGSGTRFIGNNISRFEENDLCIIGSDIPHLYKNDPAYLDTNSSLVVSSIDIHFAPSSFGEGFVERPEMYMFKKFLEDSQYGYSINNEHKPKTISMLRSMVEMNNTDRFLGLIQLLTFLASTKNAVQKLLNEPYNKVKNTDINKIHIAYDFILKNYNRTFYLSEVSDLLNMSEVSFSRYFKKHTRKSFSEYVTKIRISQACKLLLEKELSIAEVAFMCGYENMSNFYRQFKSTMGILPKEYLKGIKG